MSNHQPSWGLYGAPVFSGDVYQRPFKSLGLTPQRVMGGMAGTWEASSDPSNPDATPVLDGWGWADFWSASDWQQWYALVKEKYGKPVADKRFIDSYLSAGFGAKSYDWRSFNESFRQFLKNEGLLDAAYGDVAALKVIGAAVDIVSKASDAASAAAGSAINLTQLLLYGAVIGVLFVGYQYLKPRR